MSYLVALADQLQDFGRMNYEPSARKPGEAPGADAASLDVHYPCEAVELETEGEAPNMKGHIHFRFGKEDQKPFGTEEDGAKRAAGKKVPEGKPEPTFGPEGWLNHSGLFSGVTVTVSHSPTPTPLSTTRTREPESPPTAKAG